MAYVQFDPGFSRHPKRLKAGPIASWLWASGIDYCVEHLTDGFLPHEAIPSLVPSLTRGQRGKAIAALLDTHAWEPSPGGYQTHDYEDYQRSAAEVRRERETGRQRAKAWREARQTNGERTEERTANVRSTNAERTRASRAELSRAELSREEEKERSAAPGSSVGVQSDQLRGALLTQSVAGSLNGEDDEADAIIARSMKITIAEVRRRRAAIGAQP